MPLQPDSAPNHRGNGAFFDPFGSFLPTLWFHDVADRTRGNVQRANARWGRLSAPPGRGKVAWIACGENGLSLRLAVEFARSIHSARDNLRIVLTTEGAHRELLAPLQKLDRVAVCDAPSDRPGAIRRTLRRLDPLALVFVGCLPRRNLAAACRSVAHVIAIDPPSPNTTTAFERTYPATAQTAPSRHSAAPADLVTLLCGASSRPDFAVKVNGAITRHLWWWHGDDVPQALRFCALFRGHFPDDVLFISGAAALGLDRSAPGALALSAWREDVIAAGSIVLADDPGFLPAIAESCTGVHLAAADRPSLWRALAGGGAPSCSGLPILPAVDLEKVMVETADEAALIALWQHYRNHPVAAQNRSRTALERFSEERGRAAEAAAELMQRVRGWN